MQHLFQNFADYAQIMHKTCKLRNNSAQIMHKYCILCTNYAQNHALNAFSMQKLGKTSAGYAKFIQKLCTNMQKLRKNYAKIMHIRVNCIL